MLIPGGSNLREGNCNGLFAYGKLRIAINSSISGKTIRLGLKMLTSHPSIVWKVSKGSPIAILRKNDFKLVYVCF
jgi:hypothetical protein